MSLKPVVHLDLPIFPGIFKKIKNDPNVIFRGLGKMIHEIKLRQKIPDTVPLHFLLLPAKQAKGVAYPTPLIASRNARAQV